MPEATALSAPMRDALRKQEHADLVVGIPSFRNAATIGHVARVAAEGLRTYFPGRRVAIVNADGGSQDGTSDRVRAEADGVPAIAGPYQGPSGKGSAFRAIFEAVRLLGADACAVVDSDLRSITPEWIERLIGPIVRGQAEYVTPLDRNVLELEAHLRVSRGVAALLPPYSLTHCCALAALRL